MVDTNSRHDAIFPDTKKANAPLLIFTTVSRDYTQKDKESILAYIVLSVCKSSEAVMTNNLINVCYPSQLLLRQFDPAAERTGTSGLLKRHSGIIALQMVVRVTRREEIRN